MHRGLAIETSGRIGSVALVEGEAVVAEEQFAHGLRHAAQIVPMIDRLCRGRGWGPGDLEEVYVSAGPGSFTGLRIGITLAKTLAFALQGDLSSLRTGADSGVDASATRCVAARVKLVAVPTVRVLVENAPAEARQVIVVLDAKREQIFTARFERLLEGSQTGSQGGNATRRPEGSVAPVPGVSHEPRTPNPEPWFEVEPAHLDSLAAMLARAPRPVYLLGEGVAYHEKFIPADDPGIVITPPELWQARASAVAKVGVDLARQGNYADPYQLAPIYIRLPEAEEKWRAENASG